MISTILEILKQVLRRLYTIFKQSVLGIRQNYFLDGVIEFFKMFLNKNNTFGIKMRIKLSIRHLMRNDYKVPVPYNNAY